MVEYFLRLCGIKSINCQTFMFMYFYIAKEIRTFEIEAIFNATCPILADFLGTNLIKNKSLNFLNVSFLIVFIVEVVILPNIINKLTYFLTKKVLKNKNE